MLSRGEWIEKQTVAKAFLSYYGDYAFDKLTRGRDIALRCHRPSEAPRRNERRKTCRSGSCFCRLTLHSATGSAQRADPTSVCQRHNLTYYRRRKNKKGSLGKKPRVKKTILSRWEFPIWKIWIQSNKPKPHSISSKPSLKRLYQFPKRKLIGGRRNTKRKEPR